MSRDQQPPRKPPMESQSAHQIHHDVDANKPPRHHAPIQHKSAGASPGSAQHLASRIAKARDKKSVKSLYGKALRP